MNSYKDLIVWQKGIQLTLEIYKQTQVFPSSELYGLVSQMRRAAISIPSNIAEGTVRQTTKEYIQFLYISLGSVAELETQLLLSLELKYLNSEKYQIITELLKQVQKMLNTLLTTLKRKMS